MQNKEATASTTQNSSAVVVHAPPTSPKGLGIPPDKATAYTAAAANDQAWRNYRDTVPSVTDSTLDQAKAYPGLRAYVPQN